MLRERRLKERRLRNFERNTMSRSRRWCFTLNNYTEEEELEFKRLEVKYICVGKEIGENGTPHLQGFVCFDQPKGLPGVRKVSGRAHWEITMGTAEQAAAYCKKDGNWWAEGELPVPGKRADLDAVALKVRNGACWEEVLDEHPGMLVRYSKGLMLLKTMVSLDRTEKPEVTWLWGKTGTGKTRTAVETNKSFYIKDGTQWWDGYTQQEVIIIDDFDGKWPFRDLLRLLDRYPYQGQIKGGYVKVNSNKIIITSEFHPTGFWLEGSSQLAQIMRRCTKCTEVDGNTNINL